jgi:hypothetical protein
MPSHIKAHQSGHNTHQTTGHTRKKKKFKAPGTLKEIMAMNKKSPKSLRDLLGRD